MIKYNKDFFHKHQKSKLFSPLVIISLVTFFGVYLMGPSHASGPYTTSEAETGILSGGATVKSDPNVSGGNYVEFNGQSSSCTPADAQAVQAAKNLLNLLCNLTNQANHRILSGQFIGNSTYGVPTDLSPTISQTTKTPAIIGYDFDWDYNGSATCNPASERTNNWQDIANDAQARGLNGNIIALSFHLDDPATGCQYNDLSGTGTSSPDPILTSGTQANNNLNASLNNVVSMALQLQTHGIPILYRPYHEMNGNWFWWGSISWYSQLWQYTFNYLTNHGVHNILYVYSPYSWADQAFYPGNNYVDVGAVDTYTPDTSMGNGQWISAQQTYAQSTFAPGKPFGIAEVGYSASSETPNTYNNALLLQALDQKQVNAPGASYFMSWESPNGIANQNNLSTLYNDPSVANLGDYTTVNQ